MRISKTKTVRGERVEAGTDDELVHITETVELNEDAMEKAVTKLADGHFMSKSERAIWEYLKTVGKLVEHHEKTTDC
jgi:phosphoribosyl-AMP cyclohydrolase